MIRVLIADDHALMRAGLRGLLEQERDITIVGEASDGRELLAMLPGASVDVVLLDIGMPGPGALEILRQIGDLRSDVRVLIVSMYPEDDVAVRAIEAGAAGYLTKTQSPDELVHAVKRIYAGRKYVSDELSDRLASALQSRARNGDRRRLSPREHQILTLLGNGRTPKEIAALLSVSPKTVSTHRSRMLQKLGLRTNADLVRYVIENRLVP
jgi:DNA-binding NarL/FixJ family response regulator